MVDFGISESVPQPSLFSSDSSESEEDAEEEKETMEEFLAQVDKSDLRRRLTNATRD